MAVDERTWPLDRSVDDVLADVITRARRRRNRRRAAVGSAVAAVVAVGAGVLVTTGDDPAGVSTIAGSTTTTAVGVAEAEVDVPPASTTTGVDPVPTTSTSTTEPADIRPFEVEVVTDPAGDDQPSPQPGVLFATPPAPRDPSLDLLAARVRVDDDRLVITHLVGGPTDVPPEGADGREHSLTFRVPERTPVEVWVQTLRGGHADIGFTVLGRRTERCEGCDVAWLDGAVVLTVPLAELDAASGEEGGRIARGTTLTSFAARTGRVWTANERPDDGRGIAGDVADEGEGDVHWTVG